MTLATPPARTGVLTSHKGGAMTGMTRVRVLTLATMALLALTAILPGMAAQPQAPVQAAPYTFTGLAAMGMPAAPQPWNPADYALTIHYRDPPSRSPSTGRMPLPSLPVLS